MPRVELEEVTSPASAQCCQVPKYLDPGTLPGNPPRNAIGLVLSSNWAGFVAKTWQP